MEKVSQATERNWAQIMTEEYAAGADDVEVMAALKLSRKQFEENYNDNPVFRELVDIGRIRSSAWWRGVARKNLFNKDMNVAVWNFTMKNRFGWAEKSESVVNETPEKQRSTDELRAELLAKIPGLAKQLGVVKKDAEEVLLGPTAVKDD